MLHLASSGFRCVAHDRRGHGRSSQPWSGNDMDTYADDLGELIEALDLKDAMLVGFSAGGGEVARSIGRHGTARVAKAARISAVPPLMLRTPANPDGLPLEAFDAIRHGSLVDRSQFYRDLASGPFFGANRPGAKVSQGMIDSFWLQGMQAGHKNTFDCIKAFSESTPICWPSSWSDTPSLGARTSAPRLAAPPEHCGTTSWLEMTRVRGDVPSCRARGTLRLA
jgi:non-heme chloroperoxidase